jgi:hypothetical protein
MNHLKAHPIFATLATNVADLFQVDIDDKELERVMNEDNSILACRVVTVASNPITPSKPVVGTLTSRVRTLASDTEECTLQCEFRAKMYEHPAYPLIVEEIRKAHAAGELFTVFDTLEEIGVVAAYDKCEGKVSIGLNASKMNRGVREHKPMFASRNQRSIDFVNGVSGMLDLPKPKEELHFPVGGMTPTFYITFDV